MVHSLCKVVTYIGLNNGIRLEKPVGKTGISLELQGES